MGMVSLHKEGTAHLDLHKPNVLHNKVNKIKTRILTQVEFERKMPEVIK